MSARSWILTDVAKRIWQDRFSIAGGPELKLAGSDKWSVVKETLRGGVSDGVDVVELNNGRLTVSILPTRGMGLWRGACDGLELGWKSPVALPVNPAFVQAQERGGLGWLNGFNEWLCRCGLNSNGPPGPEGTLHGRIANIPAHQVEVSVTTGGQGTIAVTGVVDETSMFGPCLRLRSTVQTVAGSNRFTVIDEVTNLRGVPGELELLYHTNIGGPFLDAGARFVAPIKSIAPRDARAAEGIDTFATFAAPTALYAEQCYFFDLAADAQGQTQVLLHNAQGNKGLSLHFNQRQLPYFTLWKNTRAEADGYVTGLEPATNFPNLKAFERQEGRVLTLPAGGQFTTALEMVVHSSSDAVTAAEREIAGLQRGHELRIHREPLSKWSPG